MEALLKTSVFCACWLTTSIFFASYAVQPVKTTTLTIEIIQSSFEDFKNKFKSEAITRPVIAIKKNLPNERIFALVTEP